MTRNLVLTLNSTDLNTLEAIVADRRTQETVQVIRDAVSYGLVETATLVERIFIKTERLMVRIREALETVRDTRNFTVLILSENEVDIVLDIGPDASRIAEKKLNAIKAGVVPFSLATIRELAKSALVIKHNPELALKFMEAMAEQWQPEPPLAPSTLGTLGRRFERDFEDTFGAPAPAVPFTIPELPAENVIPFPKMEKLMKVSEPILVETKAA